VFDVGPVKLRVGKHVEREKEGADDSPAGDAEGGGATADRAKGRKRAREGEN
jgi:hypothetical protein